MGTANNRKPFGRQFGFERLEDRQLLAGMNLTQYEVGILLARGAAASVRQDAIIAVVDRRGEILGVRVEKAAQQNLQDPQTRIFAIDGAVAKARTAAFFANNAAPLTSRTIRHISQSTITQREVQSNPNLPKNSVQSGPGFVAPIGVASQFPPGVQNTGLVDLLGIEHTNRDSIIHPGTDSIRGNADDFALANRFNIKNDGRIAAGAIDYLKDAPESYGFDAGIGGVGGIGEKTQSRGIATLPGGVPLYKYGELVGGIGVFFPGTTGFADFEQQFIPAALYSSTISQAQIESYRLNSPLTLQAEWIAFAAAGGTFTSPVGAIANVPALPGIVTPAATNARIDLVGITLESFGPVAGVNGVNTLKLQGVYAGREYVNIFDISVDQIVDTRGADRKLGTADDNTGLAQLGPSGIAARYWRPGQSVPEGYLVNPTSGVGITAAQVSSIIYNGIVEAYNTRAAIRLPLGARTSMVLAVTDQLGDVVGLYRMPDATIFSIDVAVAKARNAFYYNNSTLLQPADRANDPIGPQVNTPLGTAYTARTFRYLASARYPTGTPAGTPPGAFSSLLEPNINRLTAENIGAPLAASAYSQNTTRPLMFDAFNPGRNFRDPRITTSPNQNGVIFFPGSSGLYTGYSLLGGLGVSGDGVDQDDVVTVGASVNFAAPVPLRADQFFIRNIRLPYSKFNRNPAG